MMTSLLLLTFATHASIDGPMFLQMGDLPKAVRWFRFAHEKTPWDRDQQVDLLAVRELVNSPVEYAPPAMTDWRHRISPIDLLVMASVFGVMITISGTVWWRSQSRKALIVVIVGLLGWLALAVIAQSLISSQKTIVDRLIVIQEPTHLRTGNADSYPVVHPVIVPVGTEGTLLHTRGDWCRIQVGHFTGWVPKRALLN